MKVIFLDIDGVLNYRDYFIKINDNKKVLIRLNEKLYKVIELDPKKIDIIKYICDVTDSKVVIISSWRKLTNWILIEDYLISKGIPIIDVTSNLGDRNKEVSEYIYYNNIKDYVIIDDELYNYSSCLLDRLVKTSFYEDGINDEHVYETINILGRRKHYGKDSIN